MTLDAKTTSPRGLGLSLRERLRLMLLGRVLVMTVFLAGATPENVEPCVERRYFSSTHYLALVCDDRLLGERLRARPGWRAADDPAFVAGQIEFNRHLRARGLADSSDLTLVDTGDCSVAAAAAAVAAWLRPLLPPTP